MSSPLLQSVDGVSSQPRNDVVWNTLGSYENDSMPIGNGDIAANVWTEQNGDLVLLVAKSDAWSEHGKLDKLARIRIHIANNPFTGGGEFSQTLRPESASVEIRNGANSLAIWTDANVPVLHIIGSLEVPSQVEARVELWRTQAHSYNDPSPDHGGLFGLGDRPLPVDFAADTVLPACGNRLTWYHLNRDSVYPISLRQQHLEELQDKYPDPLLGRCFGATVTGYGMVCKNDRTLQSTEPQKDIRVDLVALTTTAPDSAQKWQEKIDALVGAIEAKSIASAWKEHQDWWTSFWNRSWIRLEGGEEAREVEQSYAIQRYMMAASSRGTFPVKFNGGLFTVGRDLPDGADSNEDNHNPDYRRWGSSYWNQNQRHLYWPMLASGDFDLLKPWFDLYLNALPLVTDRTQAYYHHEGAGFIETIDFWGLPNLNDFGWDNDGVEPASEWIRYHTQGSLEIVAMMLDQYELTRDAEFASQKLVPFADAIVTYYALHWSEDDRGKIRFYPMQSIEMYQANAVNPTPDIAGLYYNLHRLLQLPDGVASNTQRKAWIKLLTKLPPIPMGTTHDGKIPPYGQGDPDGNRIVLPAESYGDAGNFENPELYPVFPYKIYGVGKDDLHLARNTYAARLCPQYSCWGQDGEQSALLGLTDEARKGTVTALTNYGDQRFKWFWKSSNDWIPDMDNGGAGMMTLQFMLMQCDGRRIQLLPAWPAEWTADFKLHAPYQTTVEGHVEHGKVTQLKVTPNSRAKDVVILPVD